MVYNNKVIKKAEFTLTRIRTAISVIAQSCEVDILAEGMIVPLDYCRREYAHGVFVLPRNDIGK